MDPLEHPARQGRAGSLLGAVVLALVCAGVTLPVANLLIDRGVGPAVAVGVLFLAFLVPCYGVMALIGRDARRILERGAARRAHLERIEAALDARPLPFPCPADEFAGIVGAELAALPRWVQRELEARDVPVLVGERRPGEPHVLGVYEVRPVAGASWGGAAVDAAARITLYREPLVRLAGVPERLPDAVRDTLLHEIGHAFGMGEGDLDRFSIGNDPRPDAARVRPR